MYSPFFLLLLFRLLPILLAFEVTPDIASVLDGVKSASELNANNQRLTLSRIVGGQQATRSAYPYFASIYINGYSYPSCGGSLIHTDVILTAGHCGGFNYYDVIVNAYSRERIYDGHVYRSVKAINGLSYLRHPNYNDTADPQNDFTLLILANPVDTVKPVVLNDNSSLPIDGSLLNAIGLGDTTGIFLRTTFPPFLQEVKVPKVSDVICSQQLGASRYFPKNMLCAGYTDGGKDACQGDSGGPLLDTNGNQVGLTSWGDGCADSLSPGVYSRVSSATSWIRQSICLYSQDKPSYCIPAPVPLGSQQAKLRITIQMDQSPWEIGYELRQTNTNTVLINKVSGSWLVPYELVLETVIVDSGMSLNFTLLDTGGNGLAGNGNFQIVAKFNSGDILISSTMGAQIGNAVSTLFVIPVAKNFTTPYPTKSPATKSPTKSPTTKSPTRTTTSPTTNSPTKRPTTKSPTNSPATKSPTKRPTTKSPTKRPTTKSPTKRPTTKSPTKRPTTKSPTKRPTTKSPTKRPTTKSPTRAPLK